MMLLNIFFFYNGGSSTYVLCQFNAQCSFVFAFIFCLFTVYCTYANVLWACIVIASFLFCNNFMTVTFNLKYNSFMIFDLSCVLLLPGFQGTRDVYWVTWSAAYIIKVIYYIYYTDLYNTYTYIVVIYLSDRLIQYIRYPYCTQSLKFIILCFVLKIYLYTTYTVFLAIKGKFWTG